MKLELKHLAPYLPYGLRLTNCAKPMNGRMCELLSKYDYSTIKPIIRPLSEFMTLEDGTMFFSPYTHDTVDMDGGIEANIMSIPYQDFNWLVSEHFDVFGLILAGLAVDINTLKGGVNDEA